MDKGIYNINVTGGWPIDGYACEKLIFLTAPALFEIFRTPEVFRLSQTLWWLGCNIISEFLSVTYQHWLWKKRNNLISNFEIWCDVKICDTGCNSQSMTVQKNMSKCFLEATQKKFVRKFLMTTYKLNF